MFVRLIVQGCAVASMLGLLEAREAATHERGEGLREAAALAAAALEAAEIELDRRVIARELVEALAVSAAGTNAVTEAEREAKAVTVPLPGAIVPPWREGLYAMGGPADVLGLGGVIEQIEEHHRRAGLVFADEFQAGFGYAVEEQVQQVQRLVHAGTTLYKPARHHGRRPTATSRTRLRH
ncbi:hypothetical protein [Streptomyces sp. NPDC057686]|uniref:hypothetical protein n=1 Tax=Streptomyces sp. NPDC057686 TaxID=3346212 RepID=UPI003678101A